MHSHLIADADLAEVHVQLLAQTQSMVQRNTRLVNISLGWTALQDKHAVEDLLGQLLIWCFGLQLQPCSTPFVHALQNYQFAHVLLSLQTTVAWTTSRSH